MKRKSLTGCFLLLCLLLTVVCTSCANDAGDPSSEGKTEISIALNYTLGADHGGLIAAQQLGYFEEEGLEVSVVPWSAQTRAESLLTAGTVDMAYFASIDDALVNIAAERDFKALGALNLSDPVWIGVRDDSNIFRPADLDGKVYGGYGSTKEPYLLSALIMADGGKGEFENVTLGTSSYEAVYSGQVDAALFFSYSDTINAEYKDHEMRYFKFSDYEEIPTQYAVIVTANNKFLTENPEAAKKFMRALVRGYEYQLDHPEEVADMLIEGGAEADRDFLVASVTEFNNFLCNDKGEICVMDLEVWQDRADFWMQYGFLVDGDGAVLEEFPDITQYVTNDYLPE